jgi:hypothetical protein
MWEICPVGESGIEITGPEATYSIKGTNSWETVTVLKAGKTVEETTLRHSGHDWILEARDEQNREIRLVVHPTKERIKTDVTLGGESFSVESIASEHGMRLGQQVKKRNYPMTMHTKVFADKFATDVKFRRDIRAQNRLHLPIIAEANGVIAACVAVCAVCGLEGVFACLWCGSCIESI